jgi:hypothetical protein
MNDLLNKNFINDNSTKPPLGLIPKRIYNQRIDNIRFNEVCERFNEVCGAIARYYDARLNIKIEWIEEYNELVDYLNKSEKKS